MDRDPFGTVKRVAAIGYKQVELSPLSKTPPKHTAKAQERSWAIRSPFRPPKVKFNFPLAKQQPA